MPSEYLHPSDRDPLVSADLEFLAEQLSRDAQWISSKYPACKPETLARRPTRFRWVSVACAAALLLLAIDGWYLWSRPSATPNVGDLAENKPVITTTTPVTPSPTSIIHPAAVKTRPAAAVVNGQLFNNLNGAEKAAVIDLIEKKAIPDVNQ